MPPTNTCISCLEEIKLGAKRCPHCHQIQSVLHSLNTNSKFLWLVVASLIAILFYALYTALTFDPQHQKLNPPILSNPTLIAIDTNAGPFITCFGHIENPNRERLNSVFLQAKFYDSSGEEIDRIMHKFEMTLRGGLALDTRIRGGAAHLPGRYNSCDIQVLEYK